MPATAPDVPLMLFADLLAGVVVAVGNFLFELLRVARRMFGLLSSFSAESSRFKGLKRR